MTAPSTTMLAHTDALAAALEKHASPGPVPSPLTAKEVDALVREISLQRAQIKLLSAFAEQTASVIDAFSKSGVKLERVDGRWMAHTAQGWTSGETVWDALLKATRIESLADQVAKVASRIAMEDRCLVATGSSSIGSAGSACARAVGTDRPSPR